MSVRPHCVTPEKTIIIFIVNSVGTPKFTERERIGIYIYICIVNIYNKYILYIYTYTHI